MRFDFVIFDLDGTIYDSLPVAMSALLRVLREDGNDTVGMSDLQAWAGVPGHVTLSELGYRTPERMKSAADRWLRYVLEQGSAQVFPGMLDAVGELFARGVRIGIVTSRDRKIAHLLGGGSGVCPKEIEPYVETSVASGDTEKGKPSPDPILLAIERLGAENDKTLYIGDAPTDLAAAHAAGVEFGLASWGAAGEISGADYEFGNPAEIVSLVTGAHERPRQNPEFLYDDVVFDLDGTLYDSLSYCMGALWELLGRHGMRENETPESVMRFAGMPLSRTLAILGVSPEKVEETENEWSSLVRELSQGRSRMFEGTLDAVRYLHEKGVRIGLATSRDWGWETLVGPVGIRFPEELRPYVSLAVSADLTERPKPSPDPLLYYLRKNNADPKRTLYVGDAATDGEASEKAGIDFALAGWGSREPGEVRARFRPSSPDELIRMISVRKPD